MQEPGSSTRQTVDLLKQAIGEYERWLQDNGYKPHTCRLYMQVLQRFLAYIGQQDLAWNQVFTEATLNAFRQKESRHHKVSPSVIRGLARYLLQEGKIEASLDKPREPLPPVYEQYLQWYKTCHQVQPKYIKAICSVLSAFKGHLSSQDISLSDLDLEHVDTFLAEYNGRYVPRTGQKYRFYLRGFLRYLYLYPKLLSRDLAPLVVGAMLFAEAVPPMFLRPDEVRRLFASIDPSSSPRQLRLYAMVHLAYSLGLRPKEVSLLRLDDICFQRAEITLRERKAANPVLLPLGDETIKAIAAYLIGARPKSTHREIFLQLKAPWRPVTAALVSVEISGAMGQAGLEASAYWLRHTYAQNLLEQGQSIFVIKEMLGHDVIQSSKRYLSIHTELMREVLFDETL